MRLVCHELIGVMSWAACQSMSWSLIWECLTIDDFSKSPLRPCARCSLNLLGRFRPVSPMYTFPHSQGLLLGSGLSVCAHFRYLVETEDKTKNKKQKVSIGEF